MDNFETSSNASDQTDGISSNLSVVSGYEDELFEIRSLISSSPKILQSKTTSVDNRQFDVYHYENRIKSLIADLENSTKINEQLKNKILELNCRYELENHNKFEKLLSTNKELQHQLNLAKRAIREQEKNCNRNENSYDSTSVEKLRYELNSQINLLQNEVDNWKSVTEEFEDSNTKLKVQLEEEKYLLETKTNSVNALKKVISELHLQLQNSLQNNIRINNDLAIKDNEIDTLKNSKSWYENQLHICREEKNKMIEKEVKLNSELVLKMNDLSSLKEELENYKVKAQEKLLQLKKEKEELQSKSTKRKTKPQSSSINDTKDQLSKNFETTLEHYQSTISDLKLEIDSVKQEITAQQIHFDSVKKQNSDLISLNTIIKKELGEKEYEIENMQLEIKKLNMQMESLKQQISTKENFIIDLTGKNSEMQTTLETLSEEKNEVDSVITVIRENFNKLLYKFNELKSDLHKKEQSLTKLQAENHKLFMNNNWQILELEKFQSDNRKFNELEEMIDRHKLNKEILQQENTRLTKQVTEFQKRIEKMNCDQIALHNNISLLEQKNKKLTEDCKREEDMYNAKTSLLSKEIETLNVEVGNLEKLISNFKKEKETLEQEKEKLFNLTTELQANMEKPKESENNNNNNSTTHFQEADDLIQRQIVPINLQSAETCNLIEKNDSILINNWQTFNDLLVKLSALMEYIASSNDGSDHFLSNNIALLSYEPFRSLIESIKSIQKLKTNLLEKNAKYEKFIIFMKEKLQTALKEADEKYEILQKRQSNLERRLHSMNDLCIDFKENLKRGHLNSNTKLNVKDSQEIENLQILLQAKEMEIKEKQKKYQSNYRTLLRKVKEHMRGRRNAEKHATYLEELHNSVFEELNTLKLKYSTHEYELQNTKNDCENYRTTIEKLKGKLVELQAQLSESKKPCNRCSDMNEILEEKENSLQLFKGLLIEKDKKLEFYTNLKSEFEKLSQLNNSKEKELEEEKNYAEKLKLEISNKVKDVNLLEDSLASIKNLYSKVTEKLVKEQDGHIKTRKERDDMYQGFICQKEENEILSDQIKVLGCKLNQSLEKLSLLQTQKQANECNWSKKESEMQNLINSLRNETVYLKNDLQVVLNEQSFAKSFCSELKTALDLTVRQNKVLKDQIGKLSKNQSKVKSINLSLPNKWDENYIKELLRRNNAPLPNPFPELNNSLASLKNDVIGLRKQISESKNLSQSPK